MSISRQAFEDWAFQVFESVDSTVDFIYKSFWKQRQKLSVDCRWKSSRKCFDGRFSKQTKTIEIFDCRIQTSKIFWNFWQSIWKLAKKLLLIEKFTKKASTIDKIHQKLLSTVENRIRHSTKHPPTLRTHLSPPRPLLSDEFWLLESSSSSRDVPIDEIAADTTVSVGLRGSLPETLLFIADDDVGTDAIDFSGSIGSIWNGSETEASEKTNRQV